MHIILKNFKINTQIYIYPQTDLKIGLTLVEGKLDRFLMFMFIKWSFQTYCILKVKEKVDSIQMRIDFCSLLEFTIGTRNPSSTLYPLIQPVERKRKPEQFILNWT